MLEVPNLQQHGIIGIDTIQEYKMIMNFNTNVINLRYNNKNEEIDLNNTMREYTQEYLVESVSIEVIKVMTGDEEYTKKDGNDEHNIEQEIQYAIIRSQQDSVTLEV